MSSDLSLVAPVKRALLIGSPSYGLSGPPNDVQDVGNLLRRHGFWIRECCGPQATRDGILMVWNQLISDVRPDDTVLIYYSGHGGFAKGSGAHPGRRYQFIVPSDYATSTSPAQFKGIFDIELSNLVHRTTERSRNVTVILDCCFSGRMARDPTHGTRAVRKALDNISYDQVSEAYERLVAKARAEVPSLASIEGNGDAVRVVAAADSEAAFEYDEGNGRMIGAFTKALLANLDGALQANLTWKHMIQRVSDLVNIQFAHQHPHVEGPYKRVVFSQQEKDVNIYPVEVSDDGEHTLHAGQTAGVRVGNTYTIIYSETSGKHQGPASCRGTVTSVSPLSASIQTQSTVFGQQVAQAVLETEAQYRYPVFVAQDLKHYVDDQICKMKFIQLSEMDSSSTTFAHLEQRGEIICLSIYGEPRATFDANQDDLGGAVSRALCLANSVSRAAHLLSSKPIYEAQLDHGLRVGLSKVKPKGHGPTDLASMELETKDLATDGTARIAHKDLICLSLDNVGVDEIYVSVFNVTAAGRICLLSRSAPRGIRLCSGNQYVLGKVQYTGVLKGMEIRWPREIGTDIKEAIPEWLVCFVTDTDVDLRCLERDLSDTQSPPAQRGDPSQLEKIAHQLSYGQGRDISCEENPGLKWDMMIIPFSLSPVKT